MSYRRIKTNERTPYQVIDLFAGPGGLGEGFSRFMDGKAFQIMLSAEMDEHAHQTLQLRSFYRHAKLGAANGDKEAQKALDSYYAWCNGESEHNPLEGDSPIVRKVKDEALRVTLGTPEGNATVDEILRRKLLKHTKKVLIGGPPCQAYSLVGRSRNKGKRNYQPEKDHRHFLYKEYLRILAKVEPDVFVMENVKGILSAKVNGHLIFESIIEDLSFPTRALGGKSDLHYKIRPLILPDAHTSGNQEGTIDPKSFIVHSEDFGVPQARHRVILLGIRETGNNDDMGSFRLEPQSRSNLWSVIADLPRLRSRLSTDDTPEKWLSTIEKKTEALAANAEKTGDHELATGLRQRSSALEMSLPTGESPIVRDRRKRPKALPDDWYLDDKLKYYLNHSARSHMESDLIRYFYAATFAEIKGRSPKGPAEFALPGLRPNHRNWESGKFADRFRVQMWEDPSTTITSHISKDGHYFIHPDPLQCRSLTVREAARLQTFPDNYFFQGNRTQQYHQVGNAVPPYLAFQIAEIVWGILESLRE